MYNAKTIISKPTEQIYQVAKDYINIGKLVAFPTETVYGLGANGFDPVAVGNIFKAKGRPSDNPLILHIASINQIDPLVEEFTDHARLLADAFWPGPLTMVLPKSKRIIDEVSAGLASVAVRIPSHPVAQSVLQSVGLPIAAPSANRSGSPSPTSAQHVADDLFGHVDLIIDGGDCQVGLESTVVSLLENVPVVLRPGAITPQQIQAVTGAVKISEAVLALLDPSQPILSPGMKYRHYAPKADVYLIHADSNQFADYFHNHISDATWAMAFDEDMDLLQGNKISYGSVANLEEQAAKLFATLRALDKHQAQTVFVRISHTRDIGLATYNRLLRAAEFREIFLK